MMCAVTVALPEVGSLMKIQGHRFLLIWSTPRTEWSVWSCTVLALRFLGPEIHVMRLLQWHGTALNVEGRNTSITRALYIATATSPSSLIFGSYAVRRKRRGRASTYRISLWLLLWCKPLYFRRPAVLVVLGKKLKKCWPGSNAFKTPSGIWQEVTTIEIYHHMQESKKLNSKNIFHDQILLFLLYIS